jgi:hypothetical protein
MTQADVEPTRDADIVVDRAAEAARFLEITRQRRAESEALDARRDAGQGAQPTTTEIEQTNIDANPGS